MINDTLRRWRNRFADKTTAQKGQSLIIITFAFLGLIAMLGLALDLGLVYIEQVRVSRTADAAALAGVVELPFEEEAMRRAIEYIELNGYQVGVDTEVRVRGCIDTASGPRNVDGPGQTVLNPDGTAQPTPADLITGYTYRFAAENPPRAIFVVDTMAYQPYDTDDSDPPNVTSTNEENCDTALYGTANKLRVSGQVNVGMNFMQFFGFPQVPVSDRAVGENVTNLDVAVVFDVSGSMDFETTCYDCWVRSSSSSEKYKPFPSNGTHYPVSYSTVVQANNLCSAAPQAATISGTSNSYQAVEAELFSEDYPRQGWRFEFRNPGQGFWVIQRKEGTSASGGYYIKAHPMTTYSQDSISNNPQLQGMAYDSDCFKGDGGRSVSYTCWESRANTIGETPSGQDPPYVEYDFQPTSTWNGNTTYVWVRAQGGGSYSDEWYGRSPRDHTSSNVPDYRRAIFWQMGPRDGDIMSWSQILGGEYTNLDTSDDQRGYDNEWRWLKLGSFNTSNKTGWYTLRIYQGSTSFSLDRILFTDYDGGVEGTTVDVSGSDVGDERGGDVSNAFETLLTSNSGKGPGATQGAVTREGCNVCNPIFGQTVVPSQCSCKLTHTDTASGQFGAGGGGDNCTNVITTTVQTDSDLFHDIDPLRSAKEAVKNFAARLDPKFDQIGFVSFTDNVRDEWRAELQCIRWATKNDPDGVKGCYDPTSTPISYTTVIREVEDTDNTSSTNIAEGMREGLEELGIGDGVNSHDCATGIDDGSVCDRRGAARRILILMTDGSPNANDNCSAPGLSDLWQGNPGSGDKDYTCAMYYARIAANNNVTVYTIGIGSGVNRDLMTAMATGTDPTTGIEYFTERGGKYYPAANPSQLDAIFQQILSNVFVRIIG